MKKIIGIDTDLVQVVPVNPSNMMCSEAEFAYGAPWARSRQQTEYVYKAMLHVAPTDMPGMVEYSGEPFAILFADDDSQVGYSLINKNTHPHIVDAVGGFPVFIHPPVRSFQSRVHPWLAACFGLDIASDKMERNHRFLEESLELVQACGATANEAHQLVDYVYSRPLGEKIQEVGGVMVTLAALCLAQELDMHTAGETELARIWTKMEQIRKKQAGKPKHSPLPELSPPPVQDPHTKDIPIAAIATILNDAMAQAVENGANSISMPDEYVEVAHFLSFPQEYALPPSSTILLAIAQAMKDLADKAVMKAIKEDSNLHSIDAAQYFSSVARLAVDALDPQTIVDIAMKTPT